MEATQKQRRRFNCFVANKTDVLIVGIIFLTFDAFIFALINIQPLLHGNLHVILLAHRTASFISSVLLLIGVPIQNRLLMIPFMVMQIVTLTMVFACGILASGFLLVAVYVYFFPSQSNEDFLKLLMSPLGVYTSDVAVSRAILFIIFALIYFGIAPFLTLVVVKHYENLRKLQTEKPTDVTLTKHVFWDV